MTKELIYEMLVPTKYNINDNMYGHYKNYIGAYKYIDTLARNAREIMLGERTRLKKDAAFMYPAKEMNVDKVCLLLVHYKNSDNIQFDLMNYERVFKMPIDVLTSNGYWKDDNYNVLQGSIFSGGGPSVYKNGNIWLDPHEETLEEKCNSMGMDYFIELANIKNKKNSQGKKATHYDLYQIFKLGEL